MCPGWCLGSPELARGRAMGCGHRFPPGARHGCWGEIILHPRGPSIYNLLAKVLLAMNCQEVNLSAWQAEAARARCQGVQSREFCGFGVHEGSAAATKCCWAVQFSNACSGTLCSLLTLQGEVWREMELLEALMGLSKWLLEMGVP